MSDAPTVGVRELKIRLSHHLKRVRSGQRLVVTERGRPVATIHPVQHSRSIEWAQAMVEAGLAHWGGGKPTGAPGRRRQPVRRAVSAAVIEDRR